MALVAASLDLPGAGGVEFLGRVHALHPRTEWLAPVLRVDEAGFILTGVDLPAGAWPLERAPLSFETSLPGVFAAGDVRHLSVKRVAAAVGEGSVTVGSVHQYLEGLSDHDGDNF